MTESQIEQTDPEKWDMIIGPQRNLFDLRMGELWHARDLILLFVRRDFVAGYKQTILGPLWYLIQPLLTTIVFTIIFGNIAKIPTDGLPPFLFYMCGTVIFSYFASCLSKTSDTFVSNAGMFGKVYFPRLAVPVSILISNLITFSIQFGFFLVLYMLTTITTLAGLPQATSNFRLHPWCWIVVVLNILAIANIPRAIFLGRPGYAFASSCATIAAQTFLFGVALFPELIHSSLNPAWSLTIYNASSSEKTLQIMGMIALLGMPFVLAYTGVVYWVFRGKVQLSKFSY